MVFLNQRVYIIQMVVNKRKKMIEESIQRELGNILLSHPKHSIFPKITLTAVDVSPDLAIAKIFFSVFDQVDAKDAAKALKDETKFLRKSLAHNLNLRVTPRLSFVYDESILRSRKLSDLIDNAIASDEKMHN